MQMRAFTDADDLKQTVADELERVRRRSLGLTVDVLDDAELTEQHSRLMSPLVWDLAHVGNYEELWLLRAAAGVDPMRPEIDTLYDAFEHPRSERPSLPLLTPEESTSYIDLVRRKVLDSLETVRMDRGAPLTDSGFVYGMVLQHEHQHDETMLATHQLRRGDAVLVERNAPDVPWSPVEAAEVFVEGGPFVMGTSSDPWAYDNERPAHQVGVESFWIDTTPVSTGAYLRFIEEGGYDDPAWWSVEGWDWRNRSGKRAPAFWHRDAGTWLTRRFGEVEPLNLEDAVEHVCYFEAEAYARWAGRRLPTEAEWEKAASWDPRDQTKRRYPWGDQAPTESLANLGQVRYRPTRVGSYPGGASPYGARQMIGDVWEWTSTDFHGHPGFCTFPYREYSEVFFGADYKVLRGGSWATDSLACRATFRNWDFPIRRQIFAGFRTARSV
jgi:iron(II)-dependent oxidoreductase